MSSALMVIAPAMFRDEEYAEPKRILEEAGIEVVTASVEAGECRGRFGMVAQADMPLKAAKAEGYDAVVFVGGAGAKVFFDDPAAHRLATDGVAAGAIVGAICIAPSILARAGLLRGKIATSFPSQEDDLRAHGALWSGNRVEISGRIVTANGPEAAEAFGHDLVRLIAGV
jgi:protease I